MEELLGQASADARRVTVETAKNPENPRRAVKTARRFCARRYRHADPTTGDRLDGSTQGAARKVSSTSFGKIP